jgi:hypothetical protein
MPSSASSGVRDAPLPVVPGCERMSVRVTALSYFAGVPDGLMPAPGTFIHGGTSEGSDALASLAPFGSDKRLNARVRPPSLASPFLPTWAKSSSSQAGCHFDGRWITSHVNWPSPMAITTSRPVECDASVRAWHARHNATNQSRSKSEPPCERFRTWCTSNPVRMPQARHVQRDCARTVSRIRSHAATEAAGRPVARGPPARIRRRAASPTWARTLNRRLFITTRARFAQVGKPARSGDPSHRSAWSRV